MTKLMKIKSLIKQNNMYKNIQSYEEFLEKQLVERQNFLKEVTTKMVDELTEYLKGFGWGRKGKGGGLSGERVKGVKYTKTFKGKEVVIEYRNNLRLNDGGLYYGSGLNEFVHDKSFSQLIKKEKYPLEYFYWDGDWRGGCNLTEMIQRIDKFYSKIKIK